MGLIVTDGRDFFSEEKRHTRSQVACLAAGVPAYRLVNTCTDGPLPHREGRPHRPAARGRAATDPLRAAARATLEDYHLYVLLAPHLGNRGYGNTAWVGDYKGVPMLFAERDGNAWPWPARRPG